MSSVPPLLLLLTAAALAVPGRAQGRAEAGGGPARAAHRAAPIFAGHVAFPAGDPPQVAPQLAKPLLRAGTLEPGYFIVHFAHALTRADRLWLDELTAPVRRADGSELARWYLPDDALVAWVGDLATWLALQRDARVDWVGRYEPAYKIDPVLAPVLATEVLEREPAPLHLDVDLIPGHAPERVIRELEALGARVLERVEQRGSRSYDVSFLSVEAAPAILAQLAWVEGIRRIEPRGELEPLSDVRLPGELDARWVAELTRRAQGELWFAGSVPAQDEWARHGEVPALLDLLAFDRPRLLTCVGMDGSVEASAAAARLENAHVLELPAGGEASASADVEQRLRLSVARALERAGTTSASSSALLRALLIQDDETHAARGELEPSGALAGRPILRDVAAAEGFASSDDAPQLCAFQCLDSRQPLRVALVWTDEPGQARCGKRLINDLDLVLEAPDGTQYRGNHLDANGESLPGGQGDSALDVERVHLSRPTCGSWKASVRPVRGSFAEGQGYALVVSGGVREQGSSEKVVVPTTVTLHLTQAQNSVSGLLNASDFGRLTAGDDNRYSLRNRQQLTCTFEHSVPATAIVGAIRVFVEHSEPRVIPGDIVWALARGPLTSPTLVASTRATIRSSEVMEVWAPTTLVPNANDLDVVIQDNSSSDDTLLDQLFVQVDYTMPDSAPHIVSSPNPTGFVGLPYAYDADGAAQATGTAPLTWSLVSGPLGFAIQASTGLVTWTPTLGGPFSITIRITNGVGTETQTFVVSVQNHAPVPPTIFPTNSSSLVYCPPERLAFGPAALEQRLNVFLPPGTPPPGGWPVVLDNMAGGGFAALPATTLDSTGTSAPLHDFVASGIAVVDFGVTSIGSGDGLFYPPGHPSGRYESFRPADDNPEKEAEWAVQWLKTQSTFPLATNRICLRGSSEGAIIAIWAAMGADRARVTGSAQVRASTRVKGILALQPPTSVWAFDQTPALNSRIVAHYEQQALPGVPATAFGQVAPALQKLASVMGFAFQGVAARANNASQPICLLYADPVTMVGGVPADMSLDAMGFPKLHGVLGQPFIHDSWSGYVFYKRLIDLSPAAASFHAANSIFAVRDTSALAPPFNYHTRTFSAGLTGVQATAIGHDWVLRTLGVPP